MEKMPLSVVATLVALSVAGQVSAVEAVKKEAPPAVAAPAAGELIRAEKKPVRKARKSDKAEKKGKVPATVPKKQ